MALGVLQSWLAGHLSPSPPGWPGGVQYGGERPATACSMATSPHPPATWGQERGTRGRPSANAANSYLEFTACKSQKFGHWANIRPLLEKAKKLTICIGNSAPLKTFLLKNLEKFDYRFFRKQKLFSGPFWVTRLKISRVFTSFMHVKQFGREKCIAENVLVDIVTRSWERLSG